MIGALAFLLQQTTTPEHFGGGTASSMTAPAAAPSAQLFRFLLTTVPQWVQIAGIAIGVPVAMIVAWQLWKRRRAIWAWFTARSRLYKTAIIGAMAAVVLGSGAMGLVSYNYVMHKNDFCQSCHIMDTAWNRFQVTKHRELQCHACHRQPLWVSSKELFWWVYERRMAIPAHDKVPTAVCSECHVQRARTDSVAANVLLTAGHVVHLKSDSSALKDVRCTTCHGRDFHKFNPTIGTCEQSGCHQGIRVELGAMSQVKFRHCTTCHDFTSNTVHGESVVAAKKVITPKVLQCNQCHAMSEKIGTFGDVALEPHKGSCGMCHNPHTQTKPKDAFKTCQNSGCHANADTLTSFHRGLTNHPLTDCGQCHVAHTWRVRGKDCLSCHKSIFNGPPPKRAAPPPPTGASPVAIRPPARRGRAAFFRLASLTTASRAAAAPRTWWPHTSSPATPAAAPTDSAFQHSYHKGIACLTCHTTSRTHGALRFQRPAGCLACHHGKTQQATCTTCHTPSALGPFPREVAFHVSARPTTATRTLQFDHAKHTGLACARCHADTDTRAVTAGCDDCHADHHALTRDCAACHATARTGHDRSAHNGCAACHAPARFAATAASRPLCLACHQEQRSHYPAGECATCHAIPATAFTAAAGGGAGGARE